MLNNIAFSPKIHIVKNSEIPGKLLFDFELLLFQTLLQVFILSIKVKHDLFISPIYYISTENLSSIPFGYTSEAFFQFKLF